MTLIWNCWKDRQSLRGIGRVFDRYSSSIYGLISRTAGIRPPERVRSKHCLSLSKREEISRSIALGFSLRGIAAKVCRAPSTISREVKRNGGLGNYRATLADKAAWARSCGPKCCKLASNPKLCQIIGDKLKYKWSPEQIAGWLKREFPNNEYNHVSYETMYKSLFILIRHIAYVMLSCSHQNYQC